MWEEEGIEEDLELPENEGENSLTDSNITLLLWLVHFLALLQKKHFLSDAALALLLTFFSIFFKVLSQLSPQFSTFSKQFPSTVYMFHKILGIRKENFIRYVTCEKCSMVYKYEDCIEKVGTIFEPRSCTSRFSNREHSCNRSLLRRVELSNKRIIYYPI